MKNSLVLLLILLSAFITACDAIYGEQGLIHNRNYDYRLAETRPNLRIPPPLYAGGISTQYNVQTDPHYVAPSMLPPGSLAWQIEQDRVRGKVFKN